MLGKLKEVFQSFKTSVTVFGKTLLSLASANLLKSFDIDMDFYAQVMNAFVKVLNIKL